MMNFTATTRAFKVNSYKEKKMRIRSKKIYLRQILERISIP